MYPEHFLTHSLRQPRVARVLLAALQAVEPGKLVRDYLSKTVLPAHDRLFLLGIGKAAEPMVAAAADLQPDFASALLVTKKAVGNPRGRVVVMEAGHPVPDERSIQAGRAALDFVAQLSDTDLLICLISGGGSALIAAPRAGIGLQEIQLMTNALLASGAHIEEINTIRRQLDSLKGGGLARATKARVLSLLLSDVPGDKLEAIASGLTVPDPRNAADALSILDRHAILAPSNVYAVLATDQPADDSLASRVTNVVIGNNATAVQAARRQAELEGFHAEVLPELLAGEARDSGARLAETLKRACRNTKRPFCLIGGGETTVTLRGEGKGGRNQELALGAVDSLAGAQNVLLIGLATDGDDGPTDAAGAAVTGQTQQRALASGLEADTYLARNDSYSYFQQLDDLLKPGYSGTNVNDLIFLFAL
jgi:glycerate 2-kinase